MDEHLPSGLIGSDQPRALLLKILHGLLEIVHRHGHGMDSLATALDRSPDRRLSAKRRNDFEKAAVSERKKACLMPIASDSAVRSSSIPSVSL